MMTVLSPRVRRRRRRLKVAVALALLAAPVAGGAWAGARTPDRYVVMVVDSRTGAVVSRGGIDDIRVNGETVMRSAADGLAKAIDIVASGGKLASLAPVPRKPAELAGAPRARGDRLEIRLEDAWAMPDAAAPLPEALVTEEVS